jgi:hypothetical protein
VGPGSPTEEAAVSNTVQCGFESHPGHTVDPVTGLSRRQSIALALLIPVGVIASTVATVISEHVTAPCPADEYDCTRLEAREPIVIALLDASDPSTSWPLREAIPDVTRTIPGEHPVRVELFTPRCSAEAAAEDVRQLGSDPPDEPPAALVIAAACREVAVPIAQILSDRGISLVMLNDPGPVPTDPRFLLIAPQLDLEVQTAGLQGIGIVSHLAELLTRHIAKVIDDASAAIEAAIIRDGDEVLIPRARLRDLLIEAGFSRA